MKKTLLSVLFATTAVLMLVVPLAFGGASVSASASVNVKLSVAPGGMFLVGKPAVPIVSPHRITLGLHRGGLFRTRVFGLSPGRVVFVGARAKPFVFVGAPVVAVGVPGAVVAAPGVAVGAPGVVVGAPAVVVGAPGVVVGAPGVVVQGPTVVVGSPGVVVVKGKHDNGNHHGHHKGHGKHK